MTKWCGCPIVIIMIKKWLYKSFDMNIDNFTTYLRTTHLLTHPPTYLLSTYVLSIYLPTTYLTATHLPTHKPTHPPTYLSTIPPTHPPAYLPTYIATHPPTYPLTCLPTRQPTYLFTYLLFPISLTYPLPTYHPTICYLPHSLVMIWNKHVK